MSPLVSIVIPVYNTAEHLAECLESLCSQTLRDIEIICVDDGSTDGSAAILSDYSEKDDRIHVITQPNQGILAARNTGINAAAGQWIGFADSDDAMHPDMIERLVKNGEKYHTDISHCGMVFCYYNGRMVTHYGTGILKLQDHETGLSDLLNGTQIEPSMCCKLYRKSLFRDFPIESRIKRNEDLYCNFLLFGIAESAVYEDFCGYFYRQRKDTTQPAKNLMEILMTRKEMLTISPNSLHDAVYRLWLSTLVNALNLLSVSPDKNAPACYRECMELLVKEQKNLAVLSKKQQIAAKLHMKSPLAARILYRIYGKYSKYRYEH